MFLKCTIFTLDPSLHGDGDTPLHTSLLILGHLIHPTQKKMSDQCQIPSYAPARIYSVFDAVGQHRTKSAHVLPKCNDRRRRHLDTSHITVANALL